MNVRRSPTNRLTSLWRAGLLLVASTILTGCTMVRPGTYELAAYDWEGAVVHQFDIEVNDKLTLYKPVNGMCLVYPNTRVVAQFKYGIESVERLC